MTDINRYRGNTSRRTVLQTAGLAAAGLAGLRRISMQASAQTHEGNPAENKNDVSPIADTYETQAKGIRILSGHWRPHYPWEQIAWVSPSWASQDYLWLDFPEAIFTSQGLLFLSHINPPIPTVFSNLAPVSWRQVDGGIAFDRELPNGVAFGGAVKKSAEHVVDLEIYIRNGSREKLASITLQTCAFLRAIKEFSDYTRDNKFVHLPNEGWISLEKAMNHEPTQGKYRIGWRRSGKFVADLPVVATMSNQTGRGFAMSWGPHTLSLVSNPNHPCVHADHQYPDLDPDETGRIHGRIVFFEGKLDAFRPQDHFESGDATQEKVNRPLISSGRVGLQEEQKSTSVEYTAKKASVPPELTGNWNGHAWNAANELEVTHFHAKSSAHRPRVRVRVLHDSAAIYVHFRVADRFVRCTRTDYQSMVCNDSCVEFFVQPKPDKGYFNFEVNAIGTLLVSYIEDHTRIPDGFERFVRIPWSAGKSVQIYHSLEGIIYPEITADVEWTVECAIPTALLETYAGPLGKLDGQTWRANFYKCGDQTSHPHWAAWAPIGEHLNFHQPEFFAPLHFA